MKFKYEGEESEGGGEPAPEQPAPEGGEEPKE